MAKVTFKYRIDTPDYYPATAYRQKTINLDLPKNESGFILFDTLAAALVDYIKDVTKSDTKIKNTALLWCRVNQ